MSVKKAFARLEAFFQDRDTRPGILARQLVGPEKPGDARLAELLCNERRTQTRMDGSIGGSLVQTAWAAWEMMDLGLEAVHGGLDRLVSWVLGHLEAADPPTEPAPLTLPNGAVFRTADEASFAARCLGVRVLVRARRGDRPGVARLVDALATGPQASTLDLSASALAALALAPPEHRHHLDGFVHRLRAAQGKDGAWSGADLFHMLEALILAGIRPAREVIARAAPALGARQRADGSFDDPPHEERALIGFRALQIALED